MSIVRELLDDAIALQKDGLKPGRIGLALTVVLSAAAATPPWLLALLILYLVVGIAYAAWAFAQRALGTSGITRRRMAAVAWGCGLVAATIVLAALSSATPEDAPVLTPLARIGGLISGLCFWAGFFPPHWLSQAWRLPELLGYLRPTRLMAAPSGQQGVATDAMARHLKDDQMPDGRWRLIANRPPLESSEIEATALASGASSAATSRS